MADAQGPFLLPRQEAFGIPLAQAVRPVRGGWPQRPFPQAEKPASVDDFQKSRLQDQMLLRPSGAKQLELRRRLGEGVLMRLPVIVLHRPQVH